jgi:hypothetical protein
MESDGRAGPPVSCKLLKLLMLGLITAPQDFLGVPWDILKSKFAWASGTAMHRKITCQSRWNLRRASDKAYRTKPQSIGMASSHAGEGTARL